MSMAGCAAPLMAPWTENIGSPAFELCLPRCDLIGGTSNCSARLKGRDRERMDQYRAPILVGSPIELFSRSALRVKRIARAAMLLIQAVIIAP